MRCVAHLCGLIHQSYTDFSEPLKKGLLKVFDGYSGKEDEKVGMDSFTLLTFWLLCAASVGK